MLSLSIAILLIGTIASCPIGFAIPRCWKEPADTRILLQWCKGYEFKANKTKKGHSVNELFSNNTINLASQLIAALWIGILLGLAGDVETNPGPKRTAAETDPAQLVEGVMAGLLGLQQILSKMAKVDAPTPEASTTSTPTHATTSTPTHATPAVDPEPEEVEQTTPSQAQDQVHATPMTITKAPTVTIDRPDKPQKKVTPQTSAKKNGGTMQFKTIQSEHIQQPPNAEQHIHQGVLGNIIQIGQLFAQTRVQYLGTNTTTHEPMLSRQLTFGRYIKDTKTGKFRLVMPPREGRGGRWDGLL